MVTEGEVVMSVRPWPKIHELCGKGSTSSSCAPSRARWFRRRRRQGIRCKEPVIHKSDFRATTPSTPGFRRRLLVATRTASSGRFADHTSIEFSPKAGGQRQAPGSRALHGQERPRHAVSFSTMGSSSSSPSQDNECVFTRYPYRHLDRHVRLSNGSSHRCHEGSEWRYDQLISLERCKQGHRGVTLLFSLA
jgi:hypothetical protein